MCFLVVTGNTRCGVCVSVSSVWFSEADPTIPSLSSREKLGIDIVTAQYKLEHVYSKAWRRFALLTDPQVKWWFFTEDDVWINWRSVDAAEVGRCEWMGLIDHPQTIWF